MKQFLICTIVLCGIFANTGVVMAAGQQATGGTGPEEVLAISWLGLNPSGNLLAKDSPVELYLEDYFDVQLEPWYDVDVYQVEQWRVRIASGDIPDFIVRDPQQLVEIGAVREVPEEMLYTHMPKYMKECEELGGDIMWSRTVINGKNMGIPAVLSIAAAGPAMVIRKDWMEAVDVTKVPDTLAELESLFLKFRNEDPDGNGQKDTYGINCYGGSGMGDPAYSFPNVFGAFGVRLRTWTVENGKASYSMISPAYKDALEYLNSWYRKEIIDPEFVVESDTQAKEKFMNSVVGAYEGWSVQLSDPSPNAGVGGLKQLKPDAEVTYLVSPEGPTGIRGTYSRSSVWTPSSIGINVSDTKLAKILQILEELYSNPELYATAYYGFKGVHWDPDEQGGPIEKPDFKSARAKMDIGASYFRLTAVPRAIEKYYVPTWRYVVHDWIMKNQVALPFGFLPVFDENHRVMQSNVQTVEEIFYYKAITGEADIENEWEDYVQEWLNKGGRDLLAEVERQAVQ